MVVGLGPAILQQRSDAPRCAFTGNPFPEASSFRASEERKISALAALAPLISVPIICIMHICALLGIKTLRWRISNRKRRSCSLGRMPFNKGAVRFEGAA